MPHLACVLLVDFDNTSNFLAQRVLRRVTGASQVLVAITGQQGLEQLAALEPPAPELVFVNWHLEHGADMTGEQFIREVQTRYPQRRPVIAILAINTPRQVVANLQETYPGPVFYKPLAEDNIQELMQQYFPDATLSAAS